MEISSAELIMKALDGLDQRYRFTAQNIANANTPDYRPIRVSFEESLRNAAERDTAALRSVRTQIVEGEEGAVRLDLELAAASRTASRYRALVDVLSRQMSLMRSVITAQTR